MSFAMQAESLQGPSQDVVPNGLQDQFRRLRLHGLYALASVAAALLLLVGYVIKRDFIDIPPPFDRYQMMENAKKENLRLDKTTGQMSLIEDGVVVSTLVDNTSFRNLRTKTYKWEKTNDGSKVTIQGEYLDRMIHWSMKVENVPPELAQKLSQSKPLDVLYRVQFSNLEGAGLLEVNLFASSFSWNRSLDGTLTIQQIGATNCSAPMFQSIWSATYWTY